jgi:RNA polymerase sigma factor (sigma-70 family)
VDDALAIARSTVEHGAFIVVFERHFDAVFGYIARRVGRELAEDLASETFTRAFSDRARFDAAHRDARPWLFGIATNLIRGHRRTEERQLRALARQAALPVYAKPQATNDPAIAAALLRLKRGDREVLLLHALAGLSYDEIAAALGIAPGTVGSRLTRVRERLTREGIHA